MPHDIAPPTLDQTLLPAQPPPPDSSGTQLANAYGIGSFDHAMRRVRGQHQTIVEQRAELTALAGELEQTRILLRGLRTQVLAEAAARQESLWEVIAERDDHRRDADEARGRVERMRSDRDGHAADARELQALLDGRIAEVSKLAEELAEARASNEQQTERRDELLLQLRSVQDELTRFRRRVRDTAIRVADENGWCDDGLNDVLTELDLEPKAPPVRSFAVEVTLQARQTVLVHVDAVDEAAARAEVADDPGLAWELATPAHWDGETIDHPERIGSVFPA